MRVTYSTSAKGQAGVASILDQTTACIIDKICFKADRLMMMVRLKGKPTDVVIVQVYMPMTDYIDE